MNFEQEFNLVFGEKYQKYHLKSVVVKKRDAEVTITFLYPSTEPDITEKERKEIFDFFKEQLSFEKLTIKVKFLKSYLEEKLILKAVLAYIEQKIKIANSYIDSDKIKIQITSIDVIVNIEMSSRLNKFFVENKIQNDLAMFLKDNFLSDFVINIVENKEFNDEVDIDNIEIKTTYKTIKRYNVEVVKEVVGKNFVTKPEFINGIKSPKVGAIVAGFIKKIERKEFVIKKGKRAGNNKTYFNILLDDGKGKIDCVYFCPKKYEKPMGALEEFMYVLMQGDVNLNKMGKLSLYIKKIALAQKIEQEEKPKIVYQGKVVEIEKLPAMEQDTMFGRMINYNKKIAGRTIVVFDIETTGLNPDVDQIIEIGAVKIIDGNIIEKFSTFVKPNKKIPPDIVNLTGITDKMVEKAPPIEFVIKDFYDFTRNCVLSGHNIIGFDIKFIKKEGENVGLEFDNEIIDTMNEARVSNLKTSKFNLSTITKLLGISLVGAHRAWNDAYATAQVLLKLNEM